MIHTHSNPVTLHLELNTEIQPFTKLDARKHFWLVHLTMEEGMNIQVLLLQLKWHSGMQDGIYDIRRVTWDIMCTSLQVDMGYYVHKGETNNIFYWMTADIMHTGSQMHVTMCTVQLSAW